MQRRLSFIIVTIAFFIAMQQRAAAQETGNKQDTFFLAKKRGLLGRLGKSISTYTPDEVPKKIENQFLQYKEKIIQSKPLI